MNTRMARAAAAAGGLAIAAAFAVSCSQAQEATKDIASSASSAAGAAGSAASSAASAAGSVASSAASGASSAASSAASGASSAASSGASAASSAMSSAVEGATTMNVPGVGDVSLDADTAAAWTRLGGASGLGSPTGMSEKVGDGFMTPFASGTIYSSPAGAYLVQGEILRVYGEQGGPAGALGFPTGDESTTGGGPKTANGGWVTEFQNGSISWTNDGMGGFTETVTKN